VDWGDGTVEAAQVTEAGGAGSVSPGHTYASAGIYSVTVTLTDDHGMSGSSSQQIVIFDPSAGFVTGGGWILSPAGAYAADQSLSGKATFGFVSKYAPGANKPSGKTEFQFHAAKFNFFSEDYDWLVVAGARAQFKGTGRVNGAGEYGFLLTAVDGNVNGGGADRFRIKIWHKSDGHVIYDNQEGSEDSAEVKTALGGGNITIHR
jgi:PKD repeat protein